MKKYTFDFNVEAWIRCVEIEANNVEEAKETLFNMSLEEMVDNGVVHTPIEISSLDVEIEDADEDEEDE